MSTRHVYQVFIHADIEAVFAALCDPSFTRQFLHASTYAQAPRQGAAYLTLMTDGQSATEGVIEVFDPPHRLVQTWRYRADADLAHEPSSRLEWHLSTAGEGLTQLRLIHGDLAFSPLTWAYVKDRWAWSLDCLKSLLETGTALPALDNPAPTDEVQVAKDWHRMQAVQANNAVRPLIADAATGDAVARRDVVRTAYASAYHWQRAAGAGPENEARARYMIALAWLAADNPTMALAEADACLSQCLDHGLIDFDLAYAHEARARALTALHEITAARAAWAAALAVTIADSQDRQIVEEDFADRPEWARSGQQP